MKKLNRVLIPPGAILGALVAPRSPHAHPSTPSASTSRAVPHELDGWRSRHWRGADGATHSDERVRARRPVVEYSRAGARRLGNRYWSEVAHGSRGVVRRRDTTGGIEMRLFGFGPCLLRFGPAELDVGADIVSCRYPVRGGLLARHPGGAITLSQAGQAQPELTAAVSAFVPRLAFPPLYDRLQHRLHVGISRRYFRRLIAEGSP